MKKLLLICVLAGLGLQTFSFSPGNKNSTNISYNLPENLNATALQKFLNLTPKRYQELTGKRMSLKQKISYAILKSKLKRQLAEDKVAPEKSNIGLLSLIFGGAAFVFVLIPYFGLISIPLAIAAIVLGIIGLGKKKGDTKSLIGLVLGGTFLLLISILLASFSFNY